MKLKFCFIVAALLCTALLAQAQPFDIVRGFRAIPVDGRTGYYDFCPTCRDSVGEGSHICNVGELRSFLFEWKFAEGDYSLLQKPRRCFASLPTTAQLRVTGIKEDRVGRCLATAGRPEECTYRQSMPSSSWVSWDFSGSVTGATAVPPLPRLPAEYDTRILRGAADLTVDVANPFSKPLVDATIVYPVVFYNPSTCKYKVNANITHSVSRAGRRTNEPIACENFLPDPAVTCSGTRTQVNLQFAIPPLSSKVVLVALTMPKDTVGVVRRSHEITVDMNCVSANSLYASGKDFPTDDILLDKNPTSGCQCPMPQKLVHADTLVSTIDPNRKWVVGNRPYFQEGDRVMFGLQFMNSGSLPESLVYVEDELDARFDVAKASFVQGNVFRKNGSVFKIAPQGPTNATDNPRLFHLEFSDQTVHNAAEDAFLLEPGDSAIIFFSVPILESAPSTSPLPDWLLRADTLLEEIPNSAYTMFSNETVIYKTSCDPHGPLVAHVVQVPNALFWILISLAILAVLMIVFFLIRRWLALRAVVETGMVPQPA